MFLVKSMITSIDKSQPKSLAPSASSFTSYSKFPLVRFSFPYLVIDFKLRRKDILAMTTTLRFLKSITWEPIADNFLNSHLDQLMPFRTQARQGRHLELMSLSSGTSRSWTPGFRLRRIFLMLS